MKEGEEEDDGVAILYSSSQNSLKKFETDGDRHYAMQSQSFIHQVRILSAVFKSMSRLAWQGGRNPLFIKSEFSRGEQHLSDDSILDVAILYSSSQNSLVEKRILERIDKSEQGRNPLFIKSEFSRLLIIQHLKNEKDY